MSRPPTTTSSAAANDVTLDGLLEGAIAPPSIARRHALERVRDGLFGTGGHVEVGRFRVLRTLGAGAMGVVYAAHDPLLEREVALKLVHGSSVSSTEGRARLRDEARAMARLSHPNVVPVYEVLEHEDDVVVVMELVHGTDLGTWIGTPRSWREVVQVLLDAGRGLAAAHAVGVVHRDFKPHNVLVGPDGRARVSDFGLAREDDSATTVAHASTGRGSIARTGAGGIVGTPAYVAPECWAGLRAGPAADQFAFGVTAYELLFGQRPFRGRTVVAMARRICLHLMEPFPARTPVPRRVRDAIERALAVDPQQRHASMEAMLLELEAALRPRSRTPRLLLAGAAVVAAAVLAPFAVPNEAPSPPCHGFDPTGARAWTDARREAAASHGDARLRAWTETELEGYAQQLRHARDIACAGTDAAVAAAQLQCLDALERDHAFSLDLLADGDLDPQRIVSVVDELAAPSQCTTVEDDAAWDPEVAELLAQARVLLRVGRASDAYSAAELACARVRERDSLQWAECRLVSGSALQVLGRRADARPLLEEAFDVAMARRHDGIVRRAAEGLLRIAVPAGDAASARRWQEELRAVGQRLGDATAEVEAVLLEAELRARAGDVADAIALLEDAADSPAAMASGPRQRLDLALRSAVLHGRLGDSARAHALFDRALAMLDELPASGFERAAVLVVRAQQLGIEGRFSEALEGYRAALALGPPAGESIDPTVLKALDGIADALMRLGRIDEAREAAEENLRVAKLTGDDDDLADALLTRGRMHIAAEEWEAARRDAAEALVLHEAGYARTVKTAGARQLLASALLELGRLEEAKAVLEQAIREQEEVFGEQHMETLVSVMMLASIEERLGHHERAMEVYLQVRDGLTESVGPMHPALAVVTYNIGVARRRAGDLGEAVVELERAHAIWSATLGEAHVDTRDAAELAADTRRLLAKTNTHRR